METISKLIPSWDVNEYEEYQRLKSAENKRLEDAKKDFYSFPFAVKEEVLSFVPESKKQDVINKAKLDVLTLNMEMAKDLLIKINSPNREKEVINLRLNYRNYHRQLVWNKLQLGLIEKKETVHDKDGKSIYSYEIKFMIDKLVAELFLMNKELALYGLTEKEVLDG